MSYHLYFCLREDFLLQTDMFLRTWASARLESSESVFDMFPAQWPKTAPLLAVLGSF
jgi:hypothetical protein